jgi:hypothetical protein
MTSPSSGCRNSLLPHTSYLIPHTLMAAAQNTSKASSVHQQFDQREILLFHLLFSRSRSFVCHSGHAVPNIECLCRIVNAFFRQIISFSCKKSVILRHETGFRI